MGSVLVREPMYQQLNSHLRVLVASGECPVGSKFLTERQICERFGVSRATANKALSNLVSEGLLEFRKGVGTFVQGRALDYNLRALVSFTDKAISAGKQPSTQVLQFASVAVKDVLDEVPGTAARVRAPSLGRARRAEGPRPEGVENGTASSGRSATVP